MNKPPVQDPLGSSSKPSLFPASDAYQTVPGPLERTTSPQSLYSNTHVAPPRAEQLAGAPQVRCLLDAMCDGFYLLFLLRAKQAPKDTGEFRERIKTFLTEVERVTTKLGASTRDIHLCKYAFCATVDECILRSQFDLKQEWQRYPLQLQFYGDQLGGEKFFERLESTRQEGPAKVQVLEVFHMCLLLGFEGKYVVDGSEKLAYLTSRLGEEIAMHKGVRASFAPHALAPDNVVHKITASLPIWVVASMFACLGITAFTALNWQLGRDTSRQMAAYTDVVKLPPQVANIRITLP
jgi:type VI secretion system protein ImpK